MAAHIEGTKHTSIEGVHFTQTHTFQEVVDLTTKLFIFTLLSPLCQEMVTVGTRDREAPPQANLATGAASPGLKNKEVHV